MCVRISLKALLTIQVNIFLFNGQSTNSILLSCQESLFTRRERIASSWSFSKGTVWGHFSALTQANFSSIIIDYFKFKYIIICCRYKASNNSTQLFCVCSKMTCKSVHPMIWSKNDSSPPHKNCPQWWGSGRQSLLGVLSTICLCLDLDATHVWLGIAQKSRLLFF